MGDERSQDSPWSDLPTVTTFDKGVTSHLTNSINENEESKSKNKVIKKVSSSSILIGSLINQLCRVIEKDPVRSRKLYLLLCDTMRKMKLIDPSYKMGGSELVEGRYMDAIYNLITIAKATIGSENSVPVPRPIVTYISPYQDQFKETGFIASGGFGNVFKAIHKLDEVEYAIKKIIVRPERVKTLFTHLEEVKTLAKLNHTNIVSYKQAWIEPMSTLNVPQLPSNYKLSRNNKTFDNKISYTSNNSLIEFNSDICKTYSSNKSHRFLSKNQSLMNNKIINNKNFKTFNSCSDIISFREEDNEMCDISDNSDTGNNIIGVNSITNSEESMFSDDSFEDCEFRQYSGHRNQYAILYIQMALCENTLRQWLDKRSEPTPLSLVANIATQILSGLNYIHSLKIVHHDIKPSNIFVTTSGKLQVQIGDFGLACPLQRDSHDGVVGTCMYAAPEQLKGECNLKSDIYSLGIVLLELLIPMQTTMECIKMVQALNIGEIPQILATLYPQWANIIAQLIQQNPSRRPSSDELLENLKIDKDLTINKLEYENLRLQSENSILQNENKKKDQIIMDQKIKIEELQAKLAKLESKRENDFIN